MSICIVPKSAPQLPPIVHFPTRLPIDTHSYKMSCRKRLLSEQNEHSTALIKLSYDNNEDYHKRFKIVHESKDKYQHHGMQSSTVGFFESARNCRSAPGLLRRQSLTHASSTYIKTISSEQKHTSFLPVLSNTVTTIEKNMLVCQQTPVVNNVVKFDQNSDSNFVTNAQVAVYITKQSALIIDCGSPLRHTERRITNSLLLNVNDKISRKRLSTRGLKNFLDATQLNRLDTHEIVVLYDDFLRSSAGCVNLSTPMQLSPSMKCVYDEIKRYDNTKQIFILQSTFDDFYQHYSSLCYVSTSTDEDLSSSLSSSSLLTVKPLDIETFPISEVLPGLFLGSSRDAEDLICLQKHKIHTIINISTSIPCYFEHENYFDYLRLPCHDSPNQNILQYFESTFEYIHKKLLAKKNVLVHCQGGVSRSPSFIIGYLMKYHSKTFDDAYQVVKQQRSIINPNFNFLGQLTQYQQMSINA
ncbi:unnamed protein product [Adineta ricciae]|uniref:protein-tyrosine-phosphatase n=2 Tax=Adineta ricciae TaxID=249248 RepID=A0A816CAI3_ADIRI|nr:unnamed protein product [Adineta ricciae]